MGRLSLNNKDSPTVERRPPSPHFPSPYYEAGQSSLIVAEKTTARTEVVTKTAGTSAHLLSFPGWRKRSHSTHRSFQHSRNSGEPDDHGNLATSPISLSESREKALPPIPAELPAQEPLSEGLTSTGQNAASTSYRQLSHSTSALAHAALGLGLPHVMPHTSPPVPSPATEINTVAFVTPAHPYPSTDSVRAVRRSKSSQRIGKLMSREQAENDASSPVRRRTRGVSLGPSSFLNFTTSDKKGKDKEKATDLPPPTKSLSRRASFWTRKKPAQDSVTQPRPSTAHGEFLQNYATAESDLSHPLSSKSRNQKLQPRDPLPHIVSERLQSYHPSRSHDIPHSPTVELSLLLPRPMTAESPTTMKGNGPWMERSTAGPARATAVSVSEPHGGGKSHNLRVRSQTNPPLLHRLSLNVFSSSSLFSTSPISSPGSPLPETNPTAGGSHDRPNPVIVPRPMENEESPEVYLNRLIDVVSKAEVTGILASSSEPFYAATLRALIGRFDFSGISLDIALRKLLMEVGLPKETQQIDRVMEAFATRYTQCNAGLYVSDDHPYILAFSLIMLHTDAFNKSNKRKMTKADYIKNTTLPGVAPEILDYFYDNITFVPFIFIEDPLDPNAQHGLIPEPTRRSTALREVTAANANNSSTGSALTLKTNKIDPYYMIINDLLAPLRIDIESYVPSKNPFSSEGPAGKWDEKELLLAFANAPVVEIGSNAGRSAPFFGLAAGASSIPFDSINPGSREPGYQGAPTLRVTKVGIMDRKDDLLADGKKSGNRKWRSWVVILTRSQLLFSHDIAWMDALLMQAGDGQSLIPQSAILKVEEVFSVRNAVAVYDRSDTKHQHTFRLAFPDGRHLLLRASTEDDMNQWISRVNYASAFKSAGVRMRLLGMSGRSMQLTGVAAATSHLHDIQKQIHSRLNEVAKWDDDAPQELLEMLSGDEQANKRPAIQQKLTLKVSREEVELEASIPLEAEKTVEFKDTFDQVKADLAAATWTSFGESSAISGEVEGNPSGNSSLELLWPASRSRQPRLPPRSQIIKAKIAEIDDRIQTTEGHLDAQMRLTRNIATLTPFRKATRDRLVAAIQTAARRVTQLRLEIVRLRCHRGILYDDMVAENHIWDEVKHIALQTAKETLQSRESLDTPSIAFALLGTGQKPSLQGQDIQRQREESSICESFHTAIDFGPDWPSSDDLTSGFLGASWLIDSPRPSTSGSFSTNTSPEGDVNTSGIWKAAPAPFSGSQTASEQGADPQHERFYTAQENSSEEAEAWHRTRCAQRVSLVKVPSTIELSEFGRRLTAASSAAPNVGA